MSKSVAILNEENVIIAINLYPDDMEIPERGVLVEDVAFVGGYYDADLDAFIPPKPFASWVLSDANIWEAPVARPNDGFYFWDEDAGDWVAVETSGA
jgi:hypothetical protein